jgi:hypothetical protein
MIQTRVTPFQNGILRKTWWRWLENQHPNVVIRQDEGLETCRTQGLIVVYYIKFYTNLVSLYNLHQYPSNHIWNIDEIGV